MNLNTLVWRSALLLWRQWLSVLHEFLDINTFSFVGLILKAVTRSVIHYVCSSLPLRKSVTELSCVLISRPVCVSCHRTSADVCSRFLAWRVPLQGVANKLMTCGARSLVADGKRKEHPACYRPSYCQLEYWTSQPRVLYRIAVTYREYPPPPTNAKNTRIWSLFVSCSGVMFHVHVRHSYPKKTCTLL